MPTVVKRYGVRVWGNQLHLKIDALSLGMQSLLRWNFTVYKFTKTFVKSTEELINAAIKQWLGHPPSGNMDFYYLPISERGLGVPSLIALFNQCQALEAHTLQHSTDPGVHKLAAVKLEQAYKQRAAAAERQEKFDREHEAQVAQGVNSKR